MPYEEFELHVGGDQSRFARAWTPLRDRLGWMGIVHGLGEHSGRYHELAEHFCRAGFEVVAFDQIGHGRSGGPRGHVSDYDALLDDIDALVRELQRRGGRGPCWLYGHSLGGNLVLNFVLRRGPELSGAVVTSPLLLPVVPPPLWQRLLATALNHVSPGVTFPTEIDPADLSHDAQAVQRYRDDPLVFGHVSVRLGLRMLAAGRWALQHADELSLPTLLMHGAADRLTSAAASREFARRAGPVCTLRVWSDLFHELHWETQRTEVLDAALDWMNGPCCHC
jgi:alpha-beta hydrolase superfamily lysophospholipase